MEPAMIDTKAYVEELKDIKAKQADLSARKKLLEGESPKPTA